MLAYLKKLLPYLLILWLANHINWFTGKIAGEPYIEVNKPLEDSRILTYRKNLKQGTIPISKDFVCVGTSRTIAAFNPTLLSGHLKNHSIFKSKDPIGTNLGNLCNAPLEYEFMQKKYRIQPEMTILEFTPHMMIRPTWKFQQQDWPRQYQLFKQETDLWFTGLFKQWTGLTDIFYAKPRYIYHILNMKFNKNMSLSAIYYFMRCTTSAYGGKMKSDGHADFWPYIPNAEASLEFSRMYNTELNAYKRSIINARLNQDEWKAYQRIILNQIQQGHKIIIVRPPVDREIYQLENNHLQMVIKPFHSFLQRHQVPYLDMNPNDFIQTDKTHLNWFHVEEVNKILADFIIKTYAKK